MQTQYHEHKNTRLFTFLYWCMHFDSTDTSLKSGIVKLDYESKQPILVKWCGYAIFFIWYLSKMHNLEHYTKVF
jgi:hypothetical protein